MKYWEIFKQWTLSKKIMAILVFIFLCTPVQLIIFPSKRTGPFGIGLPSSMKTFMGKNVNFSIDYPSSWGAHELPQGSHGDNEVFALIINSGNTMPSVWFAKRNFQDGDINQISKWGESRILNDRSMYESISLSNVHTAKFDGLVRQYSWKEETFLGTIYIECEDLYVLENEIGYAISFCSKDKDWKETEPVFQQMIDSFDLH